MKPSHPLTFRLTPAALALLSASAVVCAQEAPVKELPTVEIRAPRVITPLPGVVLDRDQSSSNVQSVNEEELRKSQSVTVTDLLNSNLQSISVNDYSGNPFQQDVNFRGFSASPLIGTPQGVSVYLDGIRVNEPFGEVVNWDLIPINALRRLDLIPGSSPLFGLNTLGGAIALTTKDGFIDTGTQASILYGSWNRKQTQISAGGNNGTVAGFLALNYFNEDGWRTNSESTVQQAFSRVDVRLPFGQTGISALLADNRLLGNGMIPIELYKKDNDSVFTSPDETNNELTQFTSYLRWDINDSMSLTLQAHRRKVDQRSTSGDFYEDFDQQAARSTAYECFPPGVGGAQVFADGAIGVDLPGCPGLLPNGVSNNGTTGQVASGLSLQYSWVTETNNLVIGAETGRSRVTFGQTQRLGFLDQEHEFYLAPELYDELFLTPLIEDVQRNDLTGKTKNLSFFFNNVLSVSPDFHVTFGLRLNRSRVTNELVSDLPRPLYQFDEQLRRRQADICGAEKNLPFVPGQKIPRFYCSTGDYSYASLNPSLGFAWTPTKELGVHMNYSKGNRVPSTIELGCARDKEAEALLGNRAKLPGCSIPTALGSDPFLPQIISHTYEIGFRGRVSDRLNWNASTFLTKLEDDILFVSLGSRNRGVFDTFGATEREGFELGFDGTFGRHFFKASWSRVNATFESDAEIVNLSNSSALKGQRLNVFTIAPGDRIPGIPRDNFRLTWRYAATDSFDVGVTMIAHTWSYARGNENNDHEAIGTDSNGAATTGTLDPTITVEPGRKYVGSGRSPGYAVFHLTANYRITPALTLSARVDNIFDREYFTAAQLGLNPFAQSRWGAVDAGGFNFNSNDWTHSNFVGPGAPRAVWVSLNYAFDKTSASN